MTKSRLQKESNENSGELSHDDCDEGNCARTRPVSLDEIMHRRKNKHMTEGVGVAIGSETIQREDIVDTVPDHSESELEQRRGKNCSSIVKKKESDQYIKSESRKIEEKADITKCSSTKERRRYDQESDIKPKEKLSKDLVSKLIIDNTGKQGHGRSDDYEAKPEKKHPTESSSMDKHGGRSRERLFQKVHEEKNVDNALKDRHEGRSKEKPDNDRSEERSRDKSANVRHGERNKEKSGIDRHGKREREKSGIDRHGERSVEKSGKDRHGKRNVEKSGKDSHGERNKEKSNNDRHEERAGLKAGNDRYGEGNIENSNNCRHGVRNIEKSGSDRHVEMNIEKSGSDRHVEMNREKSGNDRYVERNIEKSGNDRHGKKNKEKSGTDKIEERSRQKSGNDRFEKKRRESPSNERHEEKRKEKHDLTGEQFRGKSGADKYDKRGREKTGNDKYEERSRGREGRDRYEERDRETYERESSRKHCLEDDERYEDKNSTKRHDPGRISELKEKGKSYKHYTEESKLKRRRSRSREHDMEKNRGSLSPRARKRTSCPEKEHGESLNSLKDRPGRQHSDIDINKTSSNGLKVQYRRHSGSASGLGGYSPRKRKTDAAAKTPSPTPRSPDNKRDGSGLPSGGTSDVNFGSVTSNFQSSTQTVKSSIPDPANVTPVALNTMRSLFGAPFGFSAKVTASVDSVQLTEATRPQRRLYVENVPDSVTEKALKEFINNSMLSSCIYHIQGSQPCISCIINKQKCQALVEFLTPEDASAALSFDGSSLAGSILKVRRPKDFVEVATGELRKSAATVNRQTLLDPVNVQKPIDAGDPQKTVSTVDTTSDFVKDSSHKIFICGISEAFSSEMVMEIASAFGPVSSCYCESNAKQPYAILEYVDQSIIPKACAGLNGMKLGGQVLTVVKAVPSTSSLRTTGNSLRCDIPDHARPLLEQPTQVIKLKNVVTRESLTTLSESELEEVLEDVRTECARFGSIKSVNIVKFNCSKDAADSCETNGLNGFLVSGLKSGCDKNDAMDNLEEATDKETRRISGKGSETNPDDQLCQSHVTDVPMQQLECGKMSIEDSADFANQINPSNEASHCQDNDMAPENHLHDEKTCRDGRECQDEKIEDIQSEMEASENLLKCHDKNSSKDYSETPEEKNADAVHNGDSEMKDITAKGVSSIKGKVDENSTEALARDDSQGKELALTGVDSEEVMNVKCESKKQDADPEHIFEPGSIFVEYKRTEASSMAAHCLHGRQFDGQPVMVEYVPLDRYRARFSK